MTSNQTHWGKLYGSLCLHPKWLATPAEGRALWTSALSYCMVIGSDGDIPEAVLPMLNAPGADVATSVEHLLNSGLWVRTSNGYAFHDWSEHQQTVEERKSVRAKRSEAGKASAEKRRQSRSEPNGNTSSTSDATSVEHVLSKRPTEKRREEKSREETTPAPADADALLVSEDLGGDPFDDWWKLYPHKKSKQDARDAYAKALKKHKPIHLTKMLEAYLQGRKREEQAGKFVANWPNASTWLNQERWTDYTEAPMPTTVRYDPWSKEAYSA